ncbi:MAG: Trk system potassium uptake protein TrkA [Chlamydiae bacterium]|nr:Trk system potassium uptake protein TrkA [Chlamydiota bacterium]
MNIVIIGAGDIGIHLATIFSQLDYGIVLIDIDAHKLEQATRDLDVGVRLGSGNDWELLEEILEIRPDLLIALTDDDENNLVACTIAKNLGYPQTIARIRSDHYFKQSRLHFDRLFAVDYLIGPEKLTADAILNMILYPGSIMTENFAHGSIQMRTVKVPPSWRREEIPLKQREKLNLSSDMMVGLINRPLYAKGKVAPYQETLIFPHGEDTLHPKDEVTFVGETEAISQLHKFFGVPMKIPESALIVGGSLIGINLARKLIDHGIRVRIVEKDFGKCQFLSEKLPQCTVIHRDGTDYRFLQAEKVDEVGVFVACARSDEVNFLAGSIAQDLGCEEIIISLSNTDYLPLLEKQGINHAASPRIYAANKILSIAREKTIASMVSMYNNQAEVMEVKVSSGSKMAGIPIRLLGPQLPKDFLIVAIQSRGRVFVADGDRVLSPGDTVVVISSPKHVDEIRELF